MKKILSLALGLALALFAGQAMAKSYVNGIDPNYPPFAYIDEKTGEPAGFDVDSLNWIAKTMGFEVEHKPLAACSSLMALASDVPRCTPSLMGFERISWTVMSVSSGTRKTRETVQ